MPVTPLLTGNGFRARSIGSAIEVVRLHCFLLFCVIASIAQAQSEGSYHYGAVIEELDSPQHEKTLWEALNGLDPQGLYRTDLSDRSVDMAIHAPISRTSFEAYVAPYGFTVTSFIDEAHGPIASQMAGIQADDLPDGFPIYVDTGNPQSDQATYGIAKAAWIATHPAEYERLTAPH